ncbi:MAG: hypothetical protein AB1393_09815 [Candidatus Edwardsbacteria bacterium]
MSRFSVFVVSTFLFLSPLTVAISAEEDSINTQSHSEQQVLQIFATIERAWQSGEVDSILQFVGEKRITLSFEKGGPKKGKFGKRQLRYVLGDLFKYTLLEKFSFVRYEEIRNHPEKAIALAEREYRLEKEGEIFKDKVEVILEREEEKWMLVEINSRQEM